MKDSPGFVPAALRPFWRIGGSCSKPIWHSWWFDLPGGGFIGIIYYRRGYYLHTDRVAHGYDDISYWLQHQNPVRYSRFKMAHTVAKLQGHIS